MFQNLPLPAAQDVLDSSSGVTTCIVMKKDGVLYHLLPSFSPERWKTVVLQERAVVGSVYRLVQYYLINAIRLYIYLGHTPQWTIEHHLQIILCRAHVLWTSRTGIRPFIWLAFQVWFVWASPGFVHNYDSPKKVVTFLLVPVQKGLCNCIEVPLLHLGNFMGYPTRCKFVVTQNAVQNLEHSFVTYSDFRC